MVDSTFGSDPSLGLTNPSGGYGGYSTPGMPGPAVSSSNPGTDTMYASMGLSVIGSIGTAFAQSSAAKAQGDYEAGIARTNAAIARIQAKQTLEAGDIAASRKNLETQATVGSERAAQGASGVDVASGSAASVRAGTAGAGAIDELTIKNNAARQAWGYETEAIGSDFKGQFAQLTAKSQSQQSLLTGGLQAISGPLSIESNYMRWSKYMGGGGGGSSQRLPFNLSTN